MPHGYRKNGVLYVGQYRNRHHEDRVIFLLRSFRLQRMVSHQGTNYSFIISYFKACEIITHYQNLIIYRDRECAPPIVYKQIIADSICKIRSITALPIILIKSSSTKGNRGCFLYTVRVDYEKYVTWIRRDSLYAFLEILLLPPQTSYTDNSNNNVLI